MRSSSRTVLLALAALAMSVQAAPCPALIEVGDVLSNNSVGDGSGNENLDGNLSTVGDGFLTTFLDGSGLNTGDNAGTDNTLDLGGVVDSTVTGLKGLLGGK